jgi:hypothetical protein
MTDILRERKRRIDATRDLLNLSYRQQIQHGHLSVLLDRRQTVLRKPEVSRLDFEIAAVKKQLGDAHNLSLKVKRMFGNFDSNAHEVHRQLKNKFQDIVDSRVDIQKQLYMTNGDTRVSSKQRAQLYSVIMTLDNVMDTVIDELAVALHGDTSDGGDIIEEVAEQYNLSVRDAIGNDEANGRISLTDKEQEEITKLYHPSHDDDDDDNDDDVDSGNDEEKHDVGVVPTTTTAATTVPTSLPPPPTRPSSARVAALKSTAPPIPTRVVPSSVAAAPPPPTRPSSARVAALKSTAPPIPTRVVPSSVAAAPPPPTRPSSARVAQIKSAPPMIPTSLPVALMEEENEEGKEEETVEEEEEQEDGVKEQTPEQKSICEEAIILWDQFHNSGLRSTKSGLDAFLQEHLTDESDRDKRIRTQVEFFERSLLDIHQVATELQKLSVSSSRFFGIGSPNYTKFDTFEKVYRRLTVHVHALSSQVACDDDKLETMKGKVTDLIKFVNDIAKSKATEIVAELPTDEKYTEERKSFGNFITAIENNK